MASADGDPTTVGASTELARDVDRVQFDIGFGPCLRALRGDGGAYVPDLAVERWGAYGQAAAALGVRCCVSLPVERAGEVVAVAKVYAADVDGLSPSQRQLAVELVGEVAGSIGLARTLTAQARSCNAGLARRGEDPSDCSDSRLVEIGVVEIDVRVLATQLHDDRNQIPAGRSRDMAAGVTGTCKADLVDAAAGDQRFTGAPIACYDIEYTWREAGFFDQ